REWPFPATRGRSHAPACARAVRRRADPRLAVSTRSSRRLRVGGVAQGACLAVPGSDHPRVGFIACTRGPPGGKRPPFSEPRTVRLFLDRQLGGLADGGGHGDGGRPLMLHGDGGFWRDAFD